MVAGSILSCPALLLPIYPTAALLGLVGMTGSDGGVLMMHLAKMAINRALCTLPEATLPQWKSVTVTVEVTAVMGSAQ